MLFYRKTYKYTFSYGTTTVHDDKVCHGKKTNFLSIIVFPLFLLPETEEILFYGCSRFYFVFFVTTPDNIIIVIFVKFVQRKMKF